MSDALVLGTLFLVLVYAKIFQGFKLNEKTGDVYFLYIDAT